MKNHAKADLGSAAPLPVGDVDPIIVSRTVFSEDRTHRFTLFRYWRDAAGNMPNLEDYVCGICMNPSGAAEKKGDPTVDGMVLRAQEVWGTGCYYQLNVISLRGTDSKKLKDAPVLSLPENDEWIAQIAAKARFVVVGWGNPGHDSGRGPAVAKILREVCDPAKVLCFGINKSGAPVHPLYKKRHAPLLPYFKD